MKTAVLAVCFAILAVFLVFPMGYVFVQSFTATGRVSLAVFANLFSNDLVRESLMNSFGLGIIVVLLTTAIGLPLAFVFFRYSFGGKSVFRTLFFLPMIVSPFVGAIGMRQILSRFGSLNLLLMDLGVLHHPVAWLGSGFWGIVILETLHLYPIMFLNVSASLNNFDVSCEEASLNLGAGPWETFRRVTFPLLMPGFFAASSIIFIWALTDLGAPLVFEYPNLVSVQIFNNLTDVNLNPSGYGLVFIVMALTVGLFALTRRHLERTPYVSQRLQGSAQETPLRGGRQILVWTGVAGLLLVSLTPHLSMILTSFSEKWFFSILPEKYSGRFYHLVFVHRLAKTGALNSVLYSTMSSVLDLAGGFAIGYLLARSRSRARGILDLLAMVPLAVPGIVLAFGYMTAFSGGPLDPARNPVILIVACYSIRRLPYIVRSTYASFQQMNVNLEEASMNLGAGAWTTVRRVTLPIVSPGLFAGGILVFIFCMLEVSSSLVLALKERFYPVSKVIYVLAGRVTDGPYMASALGVLGTVMIGAGVYAASKLVSKRIGEFFRIG